MPHSNFFTKENIEIYLKDFANEYELLSKDKVPLKIILIGGAYVVLNYNFRTSTNDLDFSNLNNDVIESAIKKTAKKHGLFENWLNNDFRKMAPNPDKLEEISRPYKQISDLVSLHTTNPEYIIALKLKALRSEKHDLSDITGILMENRENGQEIEKKDIEKAINFLYDENNTISEKAKKLLDSIYIKNNFKHDYLYFKRKEEAVRNTYKKIKKDNKISTALLEHNDILRKASAVIDEKLREYEDEENN